MSFEHLPIATDPGTEAPSVRLQKFPFRFRAGAAEDFVAVGKAPETGNQVAVVGCVFQKARQCLSDTGDGSGP